MMGGMQNPFRRNEVLREEVADKQARYEARAEEARLAGYQSPLRRLIDRLLPSARRRGSDLPGQGAAAADAPPSQFRDV